MPADKGIGELIDQIVAGFHHVYARHLAALRAAVRRARAVEHRDRLLALVDALNEELAGHLAKEEAIVFPWLREGSTHARGVVRVMTLEHDDVLQQLEDLEREAVAAIAAVATGDPALEQAVEDLSRFVRVHVALEDRELFMRALAAM